MNDHLLDERPLDFRDLEEIIEEEDVFAMRLREIATGLPARPGTIR